MPRHQADDGAGIDSAREEGAEGHIGAQADAGGIVEQGHEFFCPGIEGLVLLALVCQVPPALCLHAAAARVALPGAGHDVAHAFKSRPGRRDVVERQVVVDGLQVHARLLGQGGPQGFQLGAEHHALAVVVHVQRFDADAVAREVERVFARVVDGDGEHAVEPAQAGDAFALVQAQDDLGVRMRVQPHALGAQLGRQFDVVEDLAVLHHGDLAVVADKGLVAAAQVDDGQAPVADGHATRRAVVDAFVVRAAVHQGLRHALQGFIGQHLLPSVPVAKDAAHRQVSRRAAPRETSPPWGAATRAAAERGGCVISSLPGPAGV